MVDREQAAIGVLITLYEPKKPMRDEALAAGFYVPDHFDRTSARQCLRIQILTIEELLDGVQVQYPKLAPVATYRRAARRRRATGEAGTPNEERSLGHGCSAGRGPTTDR